MSYSGIDFPLNPIVDQEKSRETSFGRFGPVDFSQAPLTVAWEVTRACPLHCVHCRAEAQPHRDPNELSTKEGLALIEDIAHMGAEPAE